MTIERFIGTAKGRNRAVAFGDLVFTVGTAAESVPSVAQQTRQTLTAIETNLIDAGSAKTKLLSATVYITDITKKEEMDTVWNEWIGADPQHWPQRACVQAALAGDTLVEITVIAAK